MKFVQTERAIRHTRLHYEEVGNGLTEVLVSNHELDDCCWIISLMDFDTIGKMDFYC